MSRKNNKQYIQVVKGGTIESMPEYEKLKKRDRAKKVEVAEWGEKFDGALKEYRCPTCSLYVNYHDSFCKNCGQRIDWTEQEGNS